MPRENALAFDWTAPVAEPGDTPLAYNVYFLLGFPLAAVSAFVVMRAFDVSTPVAAVCAVRTAEAVLAARL